MNEINYPAEDTSPEAIERNKILLKDIEEENTRSEIERAIRDEIEKQEYGRSMEDLMDDDSGDYQLYQDNLPVGYAGQDL